MSGRKHHIAILMWLACCQGSVYAQHNVYVSENSRTRIVHHASRVTCDQDCMTLWSNDAAYTFDGSTLGMMSLKEMDPWHTRVMPERYDADFDFDIDFAEEDRRRITPEAEVTDEKSAFYDDFAGHSNWDKTVEIYFDESVVRVSGDTDSVSVKAEGAHLTLETSATGIRYVLSGQSSNASVKLYSERKACIVLSGVNLTNPQGPVINSQLKKRLFVELAENTDNTLTDGATYLKVQGEDQRGCIFAEGKICISGKGSLTVNSNKKCGIASDNYVHILNGFVHVNAHAPKGKAIYGRDQVIVGGGMVRTYSDGVAGKGIASDSLLMITGGVIKAITTGDAQWDDEKQDYSSCCCLKSDWDMNIAGGQIHCLSTGTGGKGISAGHSETVSEKNTEHLGTLSIANADIYVRTGGKRIPEVKTEDSHGQKTEAAASPKGIKSAGKMTFNSGNVYVRCSGGAAAEGIESKKTIEINGGKIRSYSVDDGMNAEGCYMRGGDVMVCSTENDGFDVSFLFMYGGRLYTIGGDIDQMGIDTDGKTFLVTGGEIVSLGARNCQPFSSSTQASILCNVKKNVSGIALADADGNVIEAVPTSDTYNIVSVLFSNSNIQVGSRYKIFSYKKSFSDIPVTEYDFTLDGTSVMFGSYK